MASLPTLPALQGRRGLHDLHRLLRGHPPRGAAGPLAALHGEQSTAAAVCSACLCLATHLCTALNCTELPSLLLLLQTSRLVASAHHRPTRSCSCICASPPRPAAGPGLHPGAAALPAAAICFSLPFSRIHSVASNVRPFLSGPGLHPGAAAFPAAWPCSRLNSTHYYHLPAAGPGFHPGAAAATGGAGCAGQTQRGAATEVGGWG